MINRYRIRRMFAPTAGLRGPALMAIAGLLIFGFGLGLSFFKAAKPFIENLSGIWAESLEVWVGRENVDAVNHFAGGAFLLLGVYMLFSGTRTLMRRLYSTFTPGVTSRGMVNVFVRRQQLAAGPRIVALGGGTGLSTLLRGLKQHTSNITAIVTVSDDGGSSGRLVQEMGMIPPGDIRNCLVALADAEKLMTDLFQHRFKQARGSLSGHSLGNLLIAGLVEQSGGDFDQALTIASEVLNIRGRVVPSTMAQIRLRALMEDGTEICGETKIVQSGKRIRRIFIDPDDVEAYPEALHAIREADLIVTGPGSVYTSVIPNLLVPGVSDAINKSAAVKAYVCNVMTQPGESDSFTAAEHASAIRANVDVRICDYVVVNTGVPSESTIEKYRGSDQYLVEADIDRIKAMGFKAVVGNFMNESDYVRHDPLKVASRLMDLLNR